MTTSTLDAFLNFYVALQREGFIEVIEIEVEPEIFFQLCEGLRRKAEPPYMRVGRIKIRSMLSVLSDSPVASEVESHLFLVDLKMIKEGVMFSEFIRVRVKEGVRRQWLEVCERWPDKLEE